MVLNNLHFGFLCTHHVRACWRAPTPFTSFPFLLVSTVATPHHEVSRLWKRKRNVSRRWTDWLNWVLFFKQTWNSWLTRSNTTCLSLHVKKHNNYFGSQEFTVGLFNASLDYFDGEVFLFWCPSARMSILRGSKIITLFLYGDFVNSNFLSGRFCEQHGCTAKHVHSFGARLSEVYVFMYCASVYTCTKSPQLCVLSLWLG